MPGQRKDDTYRFHLQFNTKDPDQEFAANILSTIGRKKSAFVSTAIRFYMDHSSELPMGKVKKLLIVDENDLRDMIKKELRESSPREEKRPEAAVLESQVSLNPPMNTDKPSNEDKTPNNPVPTSDDIDFMLDGLDQFM